MATTESEHTAMAAGATSPAEVLEFAAERGVEMVDLKFVDLPGTWQHMTLPLGALDAFTRMRMQDEVLRLWENRLTTMLLVTHDIDEAIYMSDRILIMTPAPGRIDREIDIELLRPRDRRQRRRDEPGRPAQRQAEPPHR